MKVKIFLLLLMTTTLLFAQGRRGGSRNMTWDESLNLTTEQMQQITDLRAGMQPAMQQMRQNMRALELELRQLSGTDQADRIAELEVSIAESRTAIDAIMEGHRSQIRELLTEDQQLIFDQQEFGPREGRGNRGGRGMGNNPDDTRGNRSGRGRR